MEAFKENLPEIEIGSSVESFRRLLDSQSELFHKQINQLQSVVVTQCKLTGVNPLAQEMAAGALSIKIGKRPRDLLNPKAVKYMQAVFSIKDAISKKESREISALFGVTVTQVRDFFTSQRSRVRKHVRLSREKAIRSNACKEQHDGVQTSNDPITPTDLVPLNSLPTTSDPMPPMDPVPLNSVGPLIAEEAPACSTQSDIPAGIDGMDKHFTENIFSMMRKEDTFSGQVKLMDWILQMQNSSVLNWFLMKGGVMILATWLSEAAIEEQTSVLLVILKVLCHLPLHNALPEHMSAILQSVNRLRFYRISDISNRARVLLSRWSKLFARSQAMKKPNGIKSSAESHSQMLLKQSIVEIMGDELWNSSVGIPEEILTPSCESLENPRRLEQAPKLLPASADDSARKHILGASSSYTRGRRKVQLVEQPGQKTSGRSPQLVRAVPVNQGRPMSADDIQKAKMRALYMQSKYGKTGSSSNGSSEAKTEGLNKPSATQASNLSPLSKLHVRPKTEEPKKPVVLSPKLSNKLGISRDTKQNIISQEPLWERCKRVQIPWQMPPEIKLVDLWRVGAGENSKEVDIQKNRNRREKETIYLAAHEIPLNAKEPWDLEMDYDDTLTPEIPTEQPPDTEAGEAHITEPQLSQTEHVNSGVTSAAPSSSHIGGGGTAEPDFELLAVLLKNPELVFALTSGQAGNLSSEETVKLLDMIKAGSAGNLNGLGKQVEEKVEVSLPSPTPSATSGTSGWRPEAVRNPFSQLNPSGNRVANTSAGVAATIPSVEMLSATSLVQPHVPPTNITIPQQPINMPSLSQQVPPAMAPFSLPQTAIVSEKHQSSFVSSLHQSLLANSQIMQTQNPEMVSAMNSNLLVAAGPSVGMDATNDVKPSPVSIPPTAPERQPVPLQFSSLFPTSILQQTQLQVQPQAQPQLQASLVPDSSVHAPLYPSRQPVGNVGPVSDSWRARQALASNPYSQANQNVYNPSYGGPVQGHPLSGPPREVNEYVGDEGFESWSPENSPTRSPEYKRGRNLPESRLTTGWDQRPDRSRQRNSPGYWDHNRLGNRRWRDRRR